jgi:hypothetical protein
VGSASASGFLLGSGPGSASIKVDAFLRYEWIGNRFGSIGRIFGGDNRDFGEFNGTSRIQTLYGVYNPAVNSSDVLFPPSNDSGQAIEYEADTSLTNPPFGNITDAARNDWIWDVPMKTRWAFGDTSQVNCDSPQRLGPTADGLASAHRFHCTGSSGNPLVAAPPIRWDLDITLTYGLNKIKAEVTGCHGYFPSFEMYVNHFPVFQHTDSGNPDDLFYGCARSVSESWEIQ